MMNPLQNCDFGVYWTLYQVLLQYFHHRIQIQILKSFFLFFFRRNQLENVVIDSLSSFPYIFAFTEKKKLNDVQWVGQNDNKKLPFLSSSSYAKHGRNAVNIPLANASIFGPDNWINSRIQSMAVSWINGFFACAWFIKILHISVIFVPAGSLLIAFKNSDSKVSHLFYTRFNKMLEEFLKILDE